MKAKSFSRFWSFSLFLMIIICFQVSEVMAQKTGNKITVTGVVNDQTEYPIPGATVVVTQIPEDKLDETFTSLTPSELEFGEDEPEEETPDAPRASGSSFDEIDDAVRTAKNPEATTTERERAAKVFTDMEGTELYEKLMTGSSEMSIRIKGLIEIRLKKPKKDFVVPDNIEDFDIRNYV